MNRLWGGGIWWRREEESICRNYRRKRGLICWPRDLPWLHIQGFTCKSWKGLMGTWASLGIYTGCGLHTLQQQRTCYLLVSSEVFAVDWNCIWVHSSECSFATSIKKKFKQKLCPQPLAKATVALNLSFLFRCCWGCILSDADVASLPDWAILGLWLSIILLKLLLLILNWLDGDSCLGLAQE